MAVAHGHGNPNWNRDETILALDVYFQMRGRSPSRKDPQIIALSETLRALPYHGEASRMETFRNPDGAAFKVLNLRSLETGKGLGHVSRMDREIWAEFGNNPSEIQRLANLIKHEITEEQRTNSRDVEDEDDLEFYEGRTLTQKHKTRERSRRLRRKLLDKRKQTSTLHCDICRESHDYLPQELQEAAFEAHHVVPIALVGESKTKVSDLALLCATCHRLIHRAIAIKRSWVGVQDAKFLISVRSREIVDGERA